ncbi:DNA alkylation repair protein [Candidatus Arthromitus sp. SFB-turkey]|uniref:DNA alkylation repair protein n=1 Tax=Candidatus Arthromitus sp. SFB-turkey TaxID=1840217 RepID=UPI0007F47CB3|nr:DNA alkylation repair protein [Candidatus Arthromitus sp. SFB-turkey]OAT86656.1 hypothetical protein A6P36_02830 [Candidatus Arthromitus sp. SFB-turkey]
MNINEKMFEFKNEDDAIAMSLYMRNKFKFLGIKSPKRKEIFKQIFENFKNNKEIDKEFVVKFFNKDYREFQYIAIDYLIKMKKYFLKDDIFFIKDLIITKSWWDTVDLIASNLLGEICKKYPSLIDEQIVFWINDENMWLRRSSIIFQLRYKENTNLEILQKSIESNIDDDEFFIQKAIGWALREYSKTDYKWVLNFINNHNLSKLSKREAEKYIKRGEFS